MPTTRSPGVSPPAGPGSTTRPRDSWPSTRRVFPRGAQPYLPSTISTSVPQTPTAIASTSTDPSRASGSGTSSKRAVPRVSGSTVIALMGPLKRDPDPDLGTMQRLTADQRAIDPAGVDPGERHLVVHDGVAAADLEVPQRTPGRVRFGRDVEIGADAEAAALRIERQPPARPELAAPVHP